MDHSRSSANTNPRRQETVENLGFPMVVENPLLSHQQNFSAGPSPPSQGINPVELLKEKRGMLAKLKKYGKSQLTEGFAAPNKYTNFLDIHGLDPRLERRDFDEIHDPRGGRIFDLSTGKWNRSSLAIEDVVTKYTPLVTFPDEVPTTYLGAKLEVEALGLMSAYLVDGIMLKEVNLEMARESYVDETIPTNTFELSGQQEANPDDATPFVAWNDPSIFDPEPHPGVKYCAHQEVRDYWEALVEYQTFPRIHQKEAKANADRIRECRIAAVKAVFWPQKKKDAPLWQTLYRLICLHQSSLGRDGSGTEIWLRAILLLLTSARWIGDYPFGKPSASACSRTPGAFAQYQHLHLAFCNYHANYRDAFLSGTLRMVEEAVLTLAQVEKADLTDKFFFLYDLADNYARQPRSEEHRLMFDIYSLMATISRTFSLDLALLDPSPTGTSGIAFVITDAALVARPMDVRSEREFQAELARIRAVRKDRQDAFRKLYDDWLQDAAAQAQAQQPRGKKRV